MEVADSFPDANLAYYYFSGGNDVSYEFDKVDTNSWKEVGYFDSSKYNSKPLYEKFNSHYPIMYYPMSYNKTFTDSTGQYVNEYAPTIVYDTISSDAFGTLNLPNGSVYTNVLRLKENHRYISSIDGSLEASDIIYLFFTNGIHWPIMELEQPNGSSWLGFYYSGTPLPLQISSFTAAWQNKMPYLQWEAANTENTKQFNIQRSADGHSFSTVGQVGVSGASYHYEDNYIPTNTVYYRLQQVDKNGQTFYSSTAQLTVNSKQLTVFPNPAKGAIHVSVPSASPVYVMIYDAIGRLVYENKNYAATQPITTESWSKGTYLVRVKDSEGWKVSSFVIEN